MEFSVVKIVFAIDHHKHSYPYNFLPWYYSFSLGWFFIIKRQKKNKMHIYI